MKLVFVVGPTAAGKSDFALHAAQALNNKGLRAEILNCDSLQVYKHVNIGTAKPSISERSLVPHLLFDFVEAGDTLTAGDYRKLAVETINNRQNENVNILFVVGGSGFYFSALEHGMFDLGKVPKEIHDSVSDQAHADLSGLFEELKAADPEYATKIGANDSYRIQRAVELIRTFGDSPTQLRSRFKSEPLPFPIIKFGFSRQRSELKQLVEARVKKMLQMGLVSEVRDLLDQGLAMWPPLASVGYKEVIMFLNNEINETELYDLIVQNTMRLAKKQMTWFKRDQEIKWFDSKSEFTKIFEELLVQLSDLDASRSKDNNKS